MVDAPKQPNQDRADMVNVVQRLLEAIDAGKVAGVICIAFPEGGGDPATNMSGSFNLFQATGILDVTKADLRGILRRKTPAGQRRIQPPGGFRMPPPQPADRGRPPR